MIKSNSKKIIIAGLMSAIGILLPFITSHGLLPLPGNMFLPMHIPVLICSYLCGAIYGGICGFLLPYLNSFVSGMPALYPNAVIMSFELMTYGIMCSLMFRFFGSRKKLRFIYPSLIISLLSGRVVYGIMAALLIMVNPAMGKLSVIAATMSGIPGIVIQLLLVPQIVRALLPEEDMKKRAVLMIKNMEATCVVVKNNKIISAASPKGIAHIIKLYDEGVMRDAFVADTIIGKAAAMIFTLAGVKDCYGKTVSHAAISCLSDNNISVTYDESTKIIENRRGDGMCPMEATVLNIIDPKEGLSLLRNKVREL